jgi:hypothetical protein
MVAMSPMPAMAPMAPMNSAAMAVTPMNPMAVTPMTAIAPMPPMKPMAMSITPMAAMAPMPPMPPMKADGKYKEVIDVLIKKGIIKDKNDFEMSLSNKRLTVDGILQPEEVHQEMLKIFVKKPGDKVNWHYNISGSSHSSDDATSN